LNKNEETVSVVVDTNINLLKCDSSNIN